MRRFLLFCILLLPVAAQAREQLRIVGSSTVFPFVSAAAEQFGRDDKFRTPIVESTGTGGGFKLFCAGIGDAYPDMSDASRPIKPAEVEQCKKNGIEDIIELKIGYDGIVFASANDNPIKALTKHDIFLALARKVPQGGKLVDNGYTNWHAINPALPDLPIVIYGPPPTEGTRDALGELVMQEACKEFPEFNKAFPDGKERDRECTAMREDGKFVEILGGNPMIQKITSNHQALAIFGYNYLEQNAATIKASTIDGVAPTFDHIIDGSYKVARSLFVYIKREHLKLVPGIREFAISLASDSTTGDDGYLVLKGLLPLSDSEHIRMKKLAASLTSMEEEEEYGD